VTHYKPQCDVSIIRQANERHHSQAVFEQTQTNMFRAFCTIMTWFSFAYWRNYVS